MSKLDYEFLDEPIITPTIRISPVEYAKAVDESSLIAELKDLRSQYDALIVPDPNEEARRDIALKMQALRDRIQQF